MPHRFDDKPFSVGDRIRFLITNERGFSAIEAEVVKLTEADTMVDVEVGPVVFRVSVKEAVIIYSDGVYNEYTLE